MNNFGWALEQLNNNKRVTRKNWNGKGMYLFMIFEGEWDFYTSSDMEDILSLHTLSFICMKTADNKLVPWLSSQTDVLSDDWIFFEHIKL